MLVAFIATAVRAGDVGASTDMRRGFDVRRKAGAGRYGGRAAEVIDG